MKDRQVYLRHLADCLQRIREYTADGRQQFMEDLSSVSSTRKPATGTP